jgi:hypothetical protein
VTTCLRRRQALVAKLSQTLANVEMFVEALAELSDMPLRVSALVHGDCFATNCAINEQQRATAPAQGDTGTEGATTPKLEDALKDLGNAAEDALTPCNGSNCTTQTKSAPPAAPCTGSNC